MAMVYNNNNKYYYFYMGEMTGIPRALVEKQDG
jgi:hypothetical protein